MSSIIEITIPSELKYFLFFSEESTSIDKDKVKEWMKPSTVTNFPYELAFFQGIEAYQPWLYAEKHIPELLRHWKSIDGKCEKLFSNRETKLTREPMKEGIALFFTVLYWIHHKPVVLQDWNHIVDELSIKPVNLVERLTFIIQRPASYHAFVQLNELFRELEKHYAKNKIKKATSLSDQ